VAGAIDWDLEKVQDDIYQREYKRQQAEQMQKSSQKPDSPVCGVSLQIISILFAAFGGVHDLFSFFTAIALVFTVLSAGLAYVTGSNVVRYVVSFVLLAVINPLL
jgi:hypothetical protein